MPDGSINMVACSHDDQIGPHNMLYQCSSAGIFGYNGTAIDTAMTWNAPTIARVATGIYRVTTQVFDIVNTNPLFVPIVSMYWAIVVGTTTFDFPDPTTLKIPYARVGRAGFTTFEFDILVFDSSGGALADLQNAGGIALEYVAFWVPGRRAVPAAATANAPFLSFGQMSATTKNMTP